MTLVAGGLLILAVLLVGPVPAMLARAGWPVRAPRAGLVLWQAVGLAGGLSAVGAGVAYGLAPLGSTLPAAVAGAGRLLTSGSLVLPVHRWLALVAAGALAGRLLVTLVGSALRTWRMRRRHRHLVDLLSQPMPDLAGIRLLDSPAAVAYCLPGRRSRVVFSAGAVAALDRAELSAVLAHERAHLAERHDLVLLPFAASAAALPWFPGVRRARIAVAGLVEMVADDRARLGRDPRPLASAIARLAGGGVPGGALAVAASVTVQRVDRLLGATPPASVVVRLAAYVAAALLVAGPTAVLLTPALG
ncbi:MAG TPA: M56 family metallopeptidase [Mycobacteriales bacterium]|nr:M56 family metallopeptidase [Mycobacteriales bacterium]